MTLATLTSILTATFIWTNHVAMSNPLHSNSIESGEDETAVNDGLKSIGIHPLSGEYRKAVGLLATLANVENQISMPGALGNEDALLRLQQARPLLDEAFSRFSQDLELWSRQHPAESRQLFTLILPAVGLAVVTVSVISALVLGFAYVFTTFGASNIAGVLSGLLAGRSLSLPGLEGMSNLAPDLFYNVSFWKDLENMASSDNQAMLTNVLEAIEKFNKLQDHRREEIRMQSHQGVA